MYCTIRYFRYLLFNRDLQEEARLSRKKVERQRQFESNWQTLLVNPSRFSQVSGTIIGNCRPS